MSDIFEDVRKEAAKEAAREATIRATIDTARRYEIDDGRILEDIMKQFSLTKEEARRYLLGETA